MQNRSKIRVGIVGLQAGRSWAAVAHLPALGQLTDQYEIVGVVNSSLESSRAAAEACRIPLAFGSIEEMASSEEIDLIVVTVRVPLHYDAIKTILSHGKHVYCEWPLGRSLAEVEELAAMAHERSVIAVTGTQARVSVAIRKTADLIKNDFIGSILSSSIRGWAAPWGDTITDTKNEEYLRKKQNGADLLTIPFAHTLAAVCDVLGDIRDLSAIVHTRYPKVKALDTGKFIDADAPDFISVIGNLNKEAPFSINYQGANSVNGDAIIWEIEGSKGKIVLKAQTGHTQMADFTISHYTPSSQEPELINIDNKEESFGPHTNVREMYNRIASDILHGTNSAPSFDDAVILHKLIDDIRFSSSRKQWVIPSTHSRNLPDV
ncbi:hypothetical protein DYBT9275_01654 [Dyadobacter sp. CECT 9275]|uniref:Oxidoreductase n=1 Tax=Dyadobacter helix TaxID=2822344 RepID=A0A916JCI1_9BACT|nr:Gfo/Idh/MocA family oxidoreductase [Dyadobacter sp. CECT 9275]CAG4995504.1 hypothetical protein DYBT9275_01654 [Dyadobacter sp. CECT 9275]